MGSLDGIVRPFQTPDIGPVPYPSQSSDSIISENPKVICGENGSALTRSGQVSLTITYYQIKKPKERVAS